MACESLLGEGGFANHFQEKQRLASSGKEDVVHTIQCFGRQLEGKQQLVIYNCSSAGAAAVLAECKCF